jgi:ubiquitin-small subunit ribosomal protein S27Ae
MGKTPKAIKKGKKERKKKITSVRYKLYDTTKDLTRKNKFCPKCGTGIFLAKHKDRVTCGQCSYSEFLNEDK